MDNCNLRFCPNYSECQTEENRLLLLLKDSQEQRIRMNHCQSIVLQFKNPNVNGYLIDLVIKSP